MKEINELTSIRFFAAMHVVLFHNFYLIGDTNVSPIIKKFFTFGESAVTLFFILSGFILCLVYKTDSHQLKTTKRIFWWARFSRLYPIYLLSLILDLPRGLSFFFDKYDFQIAVQKIVISIGSFLVMIQSWHPRVTTTWNSPAWSLSVEAFFYLLFPILITFIFKIRKKRTLLSLLYLWPIVITVLMFQFNDLSSHFYSTFWRSFPIFRLNEFILGLLLGQYFKNSNIVNRVENSNVYSIIFWGSFVLSILATVENFGIPKKLWVNITLPPLFAVMILLLATEKIKGTKFLQNKLLVLLGGASYSMYLVHQPLAFYFSKLGVSHSPVALIVYLVSISICSIGLYKFIEIPVQKKLRALIK